MKYVMIDGTVFEGDTPADVVAAMAHEKLTEPISKVSYRKAVARRVREVYGEYVNPRSNLTFLRTLVQSGLMREMKADEA